jgi:hypothetical protein
MSGSISVRERHNSYGVISTVLALEIAIVYASENYDDWDTVTSLVGLVFSVSFLTRVTDKDALELLLASFLAGLSALIFVIALSALIFDGASDFSSWLDGNLLIFATSLSVGFALLGWFRSKRRI